MVGRTDLARGARPVRRVQRDGRSRQRVRWTRKRRRNRDGHHGRPDQGAGRLRRRQGRTGEVSGVSVAASGVAHRGRARLFKLGGFGIGHGRRWRPGLRFRSVRPPAARPVGPDSAMPIASDRPPPASLMKTANGTSRSFKRSGERACAPYVWPERSSIGTNNRFDRVVPNSQSGPECGPKRDCRNARGSLSD